MEAMPWLRRPSPPPTAIDPDAHPEQAPQDEWRPYPDDEGARDVDPYAAETTDFDFTARNPDAWAYDRRRSAAVRPAPPVTAVDSRNSAVARALDRALDDWWRAGVLPPTTLLRDGLLALEAGYPLSESQRTLLLRTALARRKGMVTALRYQDDPERTAVLLCDALLDPLAPLPVDPLRTLQAQDSRSAGWSPLLLGLLREEATMADEPRRSQAGAVLQALGWPAVPPPSFTLAPAEFADAQTLTMTTSRSPALWTVAVLLLLAAATVGTLLWVRRQPDDDVAVPAGNYVVTDATDPSRTQQIDLPAFAIDKTEVTVGDYRACVERGECSPPEQSSSATHPNYWLDPAFSRHPVVNVTWDAASRYCASLGKRLPTAAEWEVAASYAPATRRRYRYPWGDRFEVQMANAAAGGRGDTQAVGTYHPAGSSPLGMMDAAGNAAEWTSTAAPQPGPDGETLYAVKGGAYRDAADQLTAEAQRLLPAGAVEPWLGFRCVTSQMPAP